MGQGEKSRLSSVSDPSNTRKTQVANMVSRKNASLVGVQLIRSGAIQRLACHFATSKGDIMREYKTIKEFYEAVKRGDIDESKLEIVLDNDCTSFYKGPAYNDNGDELDNKIRVEEANGYYDIEKLYPLLFPKAKVEWC